MRCRLAGDAVWPWKSAEARDWAQRPLNVAKAQIFCKSLHAARHRRRAKGHKPFIRMRARWGDAPFLWQYDCYFERAHPFPALPGLHILRPSSSARQGQ